MIGAIVLILSGGTSVLPEALAGERWDAEMEAGRAAAEREDYKAAEGHFRIALELMRSEPDRSVAKGSVLTWLGNCAFELENVDDAASLLKRALDSYRQPEGSLASAAYSPALGPGAIYFGEDQLALAEPLYRLAIEPGSRSNDTPGWQLAAAHARPGGILKKTGQAAEAEEYLVKAVETFKASPDGDPSLQLEALLGLALLHSETSRDRDSAELIRQAIAIEEKGGWAPIPLLAKSLFRLGEAWSSDPSTSTRRGEPCCCSRSRFANDGWEATP